MTTDETPGSPEWDADAFFDTASPLEAFLAGAGGAGSEQDPPLFWPGIPAEEAAEEWEVLRAWVTRLVERFELDFKTLPGCWYRHNAHVEALVALRDHEHACYTDAAALTAGVEWHRALRDIEARLREWTGRSGCLGKHRPSRHVEVDTPDDDWSAFVRDDVVERRVRCAAWLEGDVAC
jgi:hypothetical protein